MAAFDVQEGNSLKFAAANFQPAARLFVETENALQFVEFGITP